VTKLRLVFVTGTRADYGKLKSLMRICDADDEIDSYVYVTGMHLQGKYGFTFADIKADGYKNIFTPRSPAVSERMDENLAYTVLGFSAFVRECRPDLIVAHGDRIEPLAAAIVGVLNNVKVAHIEGGEVTGTADEFMRHAVSKLSSLHFAANEESKYRLIQMGEREDNIYVIGSPDIDIMLSGDLPDLSEVKSKHGIVFDSYAIFVYHPVTTSLKREDEIDRVASALRASGKRYVVIYPNNDHGSDVIRDALDKLKGDGRFRFFESVPFEDFLVLLKNCEFIIGNSSAGVREACVYGVPAIDVGTRQNKRYNLAALRNIQHVCEDTADIVSAIRRAGQYRAVSRYFGGGGSAERFLETVKSQAVAGADLQKSFVELDVTSAAIQNYINEVCF
jgi:UDP-N-acetylglucosamine 2-epimerase (hydrolysing)